MDDEYTIITRILSGDTDAWHLFIENYSPYIRKTINRFVKEPEIARDLYISLLEKLEKGKLRKFDFRSTLPTWLFVVARNHCKDYYRSTKGVRHLLMALDGLSPRESRFFRLYYVQGLSIQEAYESMRVENKGSLSYLDIFEYQEAIRRRMTEKGLGKLLDRLLHPKSEPIHPRTFSTDFPLAIEETIESEALSSEAAIDGKNLKIAIDNLRSAILKLPHRDQLVLKLRFEHKRSAREIGEILDLGNEKQVYRKLKRLMDKLRSMLLEVGLSEEIFREIAGDIEDLCKFSGVWEMGAPPRRGPTS